jgi:hypothetical protein
MRSRGWSVAFIRLRVGDCDCDFGHGGAFSALWI